MTGLHSKASMVVFPNAKINIGLNIIEKRTDGYHSIESCFYPIPFTDALEVIESEKLSFSTSGITIPGKQEDNLCLKAYSLLKSSFNLPPVAIHLHKNIPIGAGLGGGSADGAFMITLLNQKFNLGIPINAQEKLAGKLGSDCPFFIHNKPSFVEGTGSIFSEIKFLLKGYYLVVVIPNIPVSTAQAYARIKPKKPEISLKQRLESLPLAQFQNSIKNDFEVSVFEQYPELNKIKDNLMKQGAIYASMSGTGSAIYGIFETKPSIKIKPDYKLFALT